MHESPLLDISMISRTNDEAVLCRQALDRKGLLKDPFVRLFKQSECHIISPLMQRGTFIRTRVIDNYLLSLEGPCQVVVLGAGHDTRWFRLYDELRQKIDRYVEIDLEEVVIAKRHVLHSTDAFNDQKYHLISADLTMKEEWLDKLRDCLSETIPIILVAECSLMYLPSSTLPHLKQLLISNKYVLIGEVIFDVLIYANDRFSTLMLDNFATHGLIIHPTIIDQPSHMPGVYCLSDGEGLKKAGLLTEEDVKIIGSELALDEYEEWNLIGKHYYFHVQQL